MNLSTFLIVMTSKRKLLCTNEDIENELAQDTDSDCYSEKDKLEEKE